MPPYAHDSTAPACGVQPDSGESGETPRPVAGPAGLNEPPAVPVSPSATDEATAEPGTESVVGDGPTESGEVQAATTTTDVAVADNTSTPDASGASAAGDRTPADNTPVQDTSDAAPSDGGQETDADTQGPAFAELGLPAEIVEALERRGVRHAFPIQAATLPDALAGRDVLGRGRTGSGKTLAFGLPMLTRMVGQRARARRPLGLVLVPTRELAMQVHDALEPYGRVLDLRMKVVCGGMSMTRQIMALERGVEILVATPGRLQDLVDRKDAVLDNISIAVLDEADQMADMGFLPEVSALLDLVPAGGQRMLFSATLDNGVDSVVEKYLTDPVTHSVDPHASSVTTMTHHVMVVQPKDKVPVTAAIAARRGRTMVFVRTKFGADRVAAQLREAGVRAEALHGGMTQGARTRTLAEYKEGRTPVLVATDVAARGIHVDGIDLVLHVDPAADSKDYLHRAGRTARAGEEGAVVTLVLPHQRRSVDRLMDDAGVRPQRLRVHGTHDMELRRITGARSLSEVRAQSVADAAVEAEEEAERLAGRIVELKARAAELRTKAAELAETAKHEEARTAAQPRREERGGRAERPDRGPRRDRGPRERGSWDREDRGERGDRYDRGGPRRDDRRGGERPYGDRQYGGRGRGERSYGERSFGGGSYGERSNGGRRESFRSGQGRDDRGGRAADGKGGDRDAGAGDRRFGDRHGTRAHGDRSYGERTYGGASSGQHRHGDRPGRADRPREQRQAGDRGRAERQSYQDRSAHGERSGFGGRTEFGDGPRGDRKPRWRS